MTEGAPTRIRILLADDENLIRSAHAALLALESDLDVVAQAASGAEATAMVRAHTRRRCADGHTSWSVRGAGDRDRTGMASLEGLGPRASSSQVSLESGVRRAFRMPQVCALVAG